MFMPVNPNLVDGMWDKLLHSLFSQKNYIIVSDGRKSDESNYQNLSHEEAKRLLARLKTRKYVRIGSSRMSPVPVHFTVDLTGSSGRLMELISLSSDRDKLRGDVSLACQFSFFENKQLKKLIIPFVITGLKDPDLRFEIDSNTEETIVHRV